MDFFVPTFGFLTRWPHVLPLRHRTHPILDRPVLRSAEVLETGYDHEDPAAVAQIVADALRPVFDYPGTTRPESLAAFRAIRAPAERRTGAASVAARPRR